MEDVAYNCLLDDSQEISLYDIQKIIKSNNQKHQKNEIGLQDELISCPFLRRSSSDKHFKFSHKAFLDFFIASSIVTKIRENTFSEDLVEKVYLMNQVTDFIRNLFNKDDIDHLKDSIKNVSGKRKPLLILLSRKLIRESSKFRNSLREVWQDDPFLDRLSKYEIIFALYRYASESEKEQYRDLLLNNHSEFITIAKVQFGTSQSFLEWAEKRLSQPTYFEDREFLYFYALTLAGNEEHIKHIEPFISSEDLNVRQQALNAISSIKSGEFKYKW